MASELLSPLMMAAFLAAVVAAWALLPLFVMALFKRSRPSAGRGITAVSWVEGGALWTTSAIAIQTGLGATDLLMGLGLTAAAALGATAAGWRTRGMLASLLPMGVFMLLRQSDFTERQLYFWMLWVAAILPLHFLGTWISTKAAGSDDANIAG